MFNIKLLIISVAISFGIGASVAGSFAWEYQSNKYEKQIAKTALKAQKSLLEANKQVAQKNKEKEDATAVLNKKALEQSKQIDKLLSDNRKYLVNGRLHVKSGSGEASTGAANSSSSVASDRASETILPGELSEFLIESFKQCDEMRMYAEVAHEYALEIEKQREEMSRQDARQVEEE